MSWITNPVKYPFKCGLVAYVLKGLTERASRSRFEPTFFPSYMTRKAPDRLDNNLTPSCIAT
jgi:hypothetical protein